MLRGVRAVTVGAGEAVVDVDPLLVHAEGSKAGPLGREVLVDGRDSRVADQQFCHRISSRKNPDDRAFSRAGLTRIRFERCRSTVSVGLGVSMDGRLVESHWHGAAQGESGDSCGSGQSHLIPLRSRGLILNWKESEGLTMRSNPPPTARTTPIAASSSTRSSSDRPTLPRIWQPPRGSQSDPTWVSGTPGLATVGHFGGDAAGAAEPRR